MRRLILFRHGKAVPHDAAPDFERGLTARGIADSVAMGAYLARENIEPDLVLISPSERTRMTWESAMSAFSSNDMRFERSLYLATAESLLRAIHAVGDSVGTLLVIGHNPSLHDLGLELIGYGDRYALARLKDHMPTAAIIILDCDIDHWSDLAPRLARLERFRVPDHSDSD
jgi:phosphohistidine phosphatase